LAVADTAADSCHVNIIINIVIMLITLFALSTWLDSNSYYSLVLFALTCWYFVILLFVWLFRAGSFLFLYMVVPLLTF